jgi:hypothetical protein
MMILLVGLGASLSQIDLELCFLKVHQVCYHVQILAKDIEWLIYMSNFPCSISRVSYLPCFKGSCTCISMPLQILNSKLGLNVFALWSLCTCQTVYLKPLLLFLVVLDRVWCKIKEDLKSNKKEKKRLRRRSQRKRRKCQRREE